MLVSGVALLVALGSSPAISKEIKDMLLVETWYTAPGVIETCKRIDPSEAQHFERVLSSWQARSRVEVKAIVSVLANQHEPSATLPQVKDIASTDIRDFNNISMENQIKSCKKFTSTLEQK